MKRKKRTVDRETTIAQGQYVTGDSAGYYAACKRVLSEKAILTRTMKSCLEEYKDCDTSNIYLHVIASAEAKTAQALDRFAEDIHPTPEIEKTS